MVRQIQLERFTGLTRLPQKAATAWSAFETSGLVGASYKPLLFLGTQVANGVNYWFIAEETLITRDMPRKVVALAINQLGDEYTFVKDSVIQIA